MVGIQYIIVKNSRKRPILKGSYNCFVYMLSYIFTRNFNVLENNSKTL